MAAELTSSLDYLSIGEQHSTDMENDGHRSLDPAGQLQNREQARLLDLISELRTLGVGDYVELPQLIVVGDQSAGKSSVLEAISGFKFPTKDDLCTTFATEINLRPGEAVDANVSIEPHRTRSAEAKHHLRQYPRTKCKITEMAEVISDAKAWIAEAPAKGRAGVFAKDVLKITVSQPNAPSLTLVDLPGIIHTESGVQTAEDVQTVRDLVNEYMLNERSIILAIVSAKNDVANQSVLKLARQFDEKKRRTLGIITKPDLLDGGPDSLRKFISLARNQEKPFDFDLGWHLLRNRDFKSRASSSEDRDAAERAFFAKQPWSNLPQAHLGVDSLRTRLQKILFKNVQSALPQIVKDVSLLIKSHETELFTLGEGRPTLSEKRIYLSSVAERYQGLLREGVGGLYSEPFFKDEKGLPQFRLRSEVADYATEFAKVMATKGHAIAAQRSEVVESTDLQTAYLEFLPSPEAVEFDVLNDVAGEVLASNKQGLHGHFNTDTIGDIFTQQAQPWRTIAEAHAREMLKLCSNFLEAIVDCSADPYCATALKIQRIEPDMQAMEESLMEKIDEIVRPYESSPPMTSNPGFVHLRDRGQPTMWSSPEQYMEPLHTIEKQLLRSMWAYYEISLWTFVDNVATLVIQNTLLDKLADVFSPTRVLRMTDETVNILGAEPPEKSARRDTLNAELRSLKEGLVKCQKANIASGVNVFHNTLGAPPGSVSRSPRRGRAVSPGLDQDSGVAQNRSPLSQTSLSQSRATLSSQEEPVTPVTSEGEGPVSSRKKAVPRSRLHAGKDRVK